MYTEAEMKEDEELFALMDEGKEALSVQKEDPALKLALSRVGKDDTVFPMILAGIGILALLPLFMRKK